MRGEQGEHAAGVRRRTDESSTQLVDTGLALAEVEQRAEQLSQVGPAPTAVCPAGVRA
ncbi:hypothetical protein ACIQU8_26800 [Streptomyces griseus]|uniref:hypothetical protein n=1 Tax=Streptomyces griseus TaxID=1911 RepID=UPI0038171B17